MLITGKSLKNARKFLDMKQHHVAQKMGITQQYLSTMEKRDYLKSTWVDKYLAAMSWDRLRMEQFLKHQMELKGEKHEN